jgi:hypothetical protein
MRPTRRRRGGRKRKPVHSTRGSTTSCGCRGPCYRKCVPAIKESLGHDFGVCGGGKRIARRVEGAGIGEGRPTGVTSGTARSTLTAASASLMTRSTCERSGFHRDRSRCRSPDCDSRNTDHRRRSQHGAGAYALHARVRCSAREIDATGRSTGAGSNVTTDADRRHDSAQRLQSDGTR